MEVPDPTNIRIITTLGHVDHGKTTLVDSLLAANNIISTRMAGKLRYLDSREDEQERGITMESSAVTLKFQVMERKTEEGINMSGYPLSGGTGTSLRTYFINLIDTPGHVDFASEVSTASRLCDGALVLVDVVEGVCTQTTAVLQQAWNERLRPILVINKFDRLITELKLSQVEAHHHLSRLVEQVNAVMGSFFAGERMEDDLRWREERERRLAEKKEIQADVTDLSTDEEEFQEKDDEDIYFAPDKGNVIFASAIDGWGFRVGKFAQLYAAKLGMKEANLRRVLWGDFFLDPKTKRVISYKHLRGRPLRPLFVQLVLDNIWAIYDAVLLNPNVEKVSKIVATLELKISPREIKTKDPRHLLSLIFSQWLSLSTSIIQTVIDVVPPPSSAQASRIPKMLYPDLLGSITVAPKNKLEKDLFSCSYAPDAFVSAYVSKMFAVSSMELPENKKKPLTAEEMRANTKTTREARLATNRLDSVGTSLDKVNILGSPSDGLEAKEDKEVILGFARLYSGTLNTGTTVCCVLPRYNPALEPTHPSNSNYLVSTTVEALYIVMGRELIAVDSVRAGNTFAIKGLEGKVLRSATLCAPSETGIDNEMDTARLIPCLINLGSVNRSTPIVRVALEPVKPVDMPKLINGLKLLSQSDPCVETFQQQTGEHVIVTAGELHLERCLKDLRERFARSEIQASKPIVPFRETAVKVMDIAPSKTPSASRGTMHGASSQNLVTFTIRTSPLPQPILQFILNNLTILKNLQRDRTTEGSSEQDTRHPGELIHDDVSRTPTVVTESFWGALSEVCSSVGGEWKGIIDRIWAFGPQKAGGCLLIDKRETGAVHSLKQILSRSKLQESDDNKLLRDIENYLETGFQLATLQGPLCAEPVEGLAYFVERLEVNKDGFDREIEQNRLAQVTGSLISAVRDACRNGLLDWSPRLMLAMYACDIQASTDVLGKVYAVVARRRGRIVAEEMKEGTTLFTVSALLPVVESFGFADEIRKRTSGAASPQLIFSGYELLDQDPFWVPTTEEELEDLGEKSDRSNVAKGYMDAVRERKGMFVDRKLVEFAEKQRTLKR